jgi:hypothetical protein
MQDTLPGGAGPGVAGLPNTGTEMTTFDWAVHALGLAALIAALFLLAGAAVVALRRREETL